MDAPTLEFAEDAVGLVAEELLQRSLLLSEWTVESCEVQLHPSSPSTSPLIPTPTTAWPR